MRRQHKLSLWVGFMLIGVAVALWAMPAEQTTAPNTIHNPRVLLDSVQIVNTQRSARFAGVTQARDRAVLSFSISARVMERPVESGARVRQGEILARLEDDEYRNAVLLAQATWTELDAQLQQARRDRLRMASLAASDVVPVAALEKVTTQQAALEAGLQAAAVRLKEARRRLNETVLTAPFSGTVTGLYLQPGELAVPGHPAIELTGDGPIELLVQVPESMLNRIEAGQSVQVQLPFANDRLVSGHVTSVAKAALAAGRLFPLKVHMASEQGVVAGLTAQLIIDLSTHGAMTVPLSAVVNPSASRPYLFVFNNGRVVKKHITLGDIIADRITVRGDIGPGDPVVISGQSQLTDGEPVEVAL